MKQSSFLDKESKHNCLLGEGRFQFSISLELQDNVAAANQLSFIVKLRISRPVREFLQPFPHLLITQYIEGPETHAFLIKAFTTLELKPHLGASDDPFMNSIIGELSTSFLRRSSRDSLMMPFSIKVVFSSPLFCIWSTISDPPINSPLMYNCG
ncbi:hypothetical protein Droror1_Dr00013613 [Drosera rotundifolia]